VDSSIDEACLAVRLYKDPSEPRSGAQLQADVDGRSRSKKTDDEYTRELVARQTQLTSKQKALLWIAGIQLTVVTSLLLVALSLSCPWRDRGLDSELVPFFIATAALLLALVAVPAALAVVTMLRVRGVGGKIGPNATTG
jgi:hypothetical protein